MCGKSHRAHAVAASSLIMLLGRLMDSQGGCEASGEAVFERTHTHK